MGERLMAPSPPFLECPQARTLPGPFTGVDKMCAVRVEFIRELVFIALINYCISTVLNECPPEETFTNLELQTIQRYSANQVCNDQL
jgi:hypothetical protein